MRTVPACHRFALARLGGVWQLPDELKDAPSQSSQDEENWLAVEVGSRCIYSLDIALFL